MEDINLIKLQHFFQVDMRIKKGIYSLAPSSLQYLDNDTIEKYSDNLDDLLKYIFIELKCVSADIFGNNSDVFEKICELEKKTKKAFYSCGYDIEKIKAFYKTYLSDMNLDFINSVKEECVGYTGRSGDSVEKANTVNEMLHFIHSYTINNEKILQVIPKIGEKENAFHYPISLRGENSPLFEQLFEQFPNDLDVGWTDMVVIDEKKMIMMVRDRGHALTIEVSLNKENARVEYFIPKLCNIDMINALPGVNKVNNDSIGATGAIELPANNLSNVLFDFISKVPTDEDMNLSTPKVM